MYLSIYEEFILLARNFSISNKILFLYVSCACCYVIVAIFSYNFYICFVSVLIHYFLSCTQYTETLARSCTATKVEQKHCNKSRKKVNK